MWERGFEETPLLLIPRREKQGRGWGQLRAAALPCRFTAGRPCLGGPSRARAAQGSLCPSGAPADSPSEMLDVLHPPGVTAECPHCGSGCCSPTMGQFAAPLNSLQTPALAARGTN